jgi:hypothetical protein
MGVESVGVHITTALPEGPGFDLVEPSVKVCVLEMPRYNDHTRTSG